jgi:aldoxime dehydratase
MVESAIPEHLKCPRTRQRRIADDFEPPYPALTARYGTDVKQVVMGYFGVQHRPSADPAAVKKALDFVVDSFGGEKGPGHWDRAQYVDEAGFSNVITIGYWSDPKVYGEWFDKFGAEWRSGSFSPEIGTFVEVLLPSVKHFETLYATDILEGVGGLSGGFSVPVQEHAYWGSMRDRIPLSQTSDMASKGAPEFVTDGLHRRVIPHENICLIRSGQDWSATEGEERRMYLEEVEPVFRVGMDFLRDKGMEVDCFANRYLNIIDSSGKPIEKSFGMSWWKSIDALERWAEVHPTHVAIFAAAMKYLNAMGGNPKLKLYHEVTVATADEQFFEYYNCHPGTGMLHATS